MERVRLRVLLVRMLAIAFSLLCLGVCVAVVLRLTLTPSPASQDIAHVNLDPGATISLYLHGSSTREAVWEIGGNVLVGVPFGVFLPIISRRLRGLLRLVAITTVVITMVEGVQYVFVVGRSFDVDDIICAAVGAALGYLLAGRWLARRVHPRTAAWWHREPRGAR
jgi:glycopeptide antibiotics resistance protein